MITKTPRPPYYSVVFTSVRTGTEEGYKEMNEVLWKEAQKLDGFIGAESIRNAEGFGITVTYFKDLSTIIDWWHFHKHINAKRLGKDKWYENYKVRIAKVERDYGM